MKTKLLTALLMLTSLCAHAQFRRSSDHKVYPYTSTLRSNDVFLVGRITPDTNYNISVSNVLSAIGGVNTNNAILISSNAAWAATNNLTVGISSSTATNIANYAAQVTTNNFLFLRYPTNQAIATSIDVGNKYTGFATNNNISLAGCANVDSTGTNISWGILTITNTAGSGAVKTITIPAAWVDVDNLGGTTIYNTNQGVLSVMVYPNLGTNFIWRGK